MKLLIVDDEELTRTGLISSVNWKELGIDEVIQADDGLNGLEKARIHRPEIILCDVRMPRMDGITMLSRLEEALPDSVAIFMSGYSDKEYLKAAIKLKALNYIEKPFEPEEVVEAVSEACDLYRQRMLQRHGESLRSMETASRLALCLTQPYQQTRDQIPGLLEELSLTGHTEDFFTTFIVHLNVSIEFSVSPLSQIHDRIRELLKHYHLHSVSLEKRSQYLVYFIFGKERLSDVLKKTIAEFLRDQYAPCGEYYIAAGDTTAGIQQAYQSYTSAVILLQNSFFFPLGTCLTPELIEGLPENSLPEESSDAENFAELLNAKKQEECAAFLETLFARYDKNLHALSNQVKDLYYKLLAAVDDVRKASLLPSAHSEQKSIVSFLETCFSYPALHRELAKETEQYFQELENMVPENPTIFLIRDYISKNYMNEGLSVKDISAHVFLSTSYVCTFFKSETGKTLNQYLTEYRMERAKQLLSDPRYKISSISSRVGYSDGNYFGKCFKKYTGFSPSEYREKISS